MADVTCALLVVTPSGKILLVHPTNAPHIEAWSLPKGIKEQHESEEDAAARECFEETGLDLRHKALEFVNVGRFPYVKGKDYHLFMYNIEEEIDVSLLKCTSHFKDRNGNQVVEVDRFQVVDATSDMRAAQKLLNKKQYKLVMNALYSSVDTGT